MHDVTHRDRRGIGTHVIGKVVPRERETVRCERESDERGRQFSWAPRQGETESDGRGRQIREGESPVGP